MPSNIQFKRGTAAALYALNPVLLRGEPGLEIDTNKVKYGNGVTPWRDLPYANPALEVVDGGEFTAGAVPAVPGTFSPPTLPGLKLWLDADKADYVHAVNSRVSLWEDASESDAKFVQSNKANRPSVANQLEDQDVVTFDGENDAMIGKLELPEEFTLLVALRRRGASADGKVIAAYTANNNTELVLCGTETGGEFGVFFDGEYSATQAVDNLVPVVYTLQFSLAGLSTRLNGLNTVSVAGFTVPPMTHLSLGGSRSDFAADNYSGDIAEIVLYDSVLSAADLLDAENYMIERWGVVNVTHPLLEGMKAFWPLNEESGNRLDITAAEVPLTPTGTVGFDSGVIENAAEFTGGNNYLQAPSDFALDGSFAISAWFKAASMAGGRSVLVQNWAAGNASGQVELGFGDDGSDTNAVFGRIATDDDIYTVVVPDLEANLWHHVVLVYSATANTLTLYLNGLQAAQVATLGSFSAGNIPLRVGIGDQTATQNDLACVVDQLGIWDRVLSLQDVQMLYNYELGKENFTADLYGDNVSLLLHMDKPANAGGETGGGSSDPYFNDVSLLLHMNGANGSTTFTDSSPSALTVTAYGSAAISTAQSKFGGASGLFDGGPATVRTAGSASFAYGTADLTIECWIYCTSDVNDGFKIFFAQNESGFNYLALAVYPGGTATAAFGPAGQEVNVTGPTVQGNTWHHFAFVRSAGAFRVYVDGVGGAPVTSSFDFTNTTYPVSIGGYDNTTSYGFPGYIDDLRITKGVARYTENFTPPTAAFPLGYTKVVTMPAVETSLLLHFDGDNNSTTFTDSGSNALTVTANGDAAISTAQSKFGGSSLFMSRGGGGYLSMPYSSALDFGTGDFTAEWWMRLSNTSDTAIFGGATQCGTWSVNCATEVRMAVGCSGWDLSSSGWVCPVEQWVHVAVARHGGTLRFFADGVEIASAPNSVSYVLNPADMFTIGTPNSPYTVEGYIDELRITKGAALYTANFTPPTLPFPNPAAQPAPDLLLHCDGTDGSTTFTDSGKNQLAVTRAGNAAISTAQSRFGGASAYFDAASALTIAPTAAIDLSSGDWTVETWWRPESDSSGVGDGSHTLITVGESATAAQVRISAYAGVSAFRLLCSTGAGWLDTTLAGTYAPAQWYHVAATRAGDNFRLFIDGLQVLSFTYAGSLLTNPGPTYIGADANLASAASFTKGHLDELRIIKGTALYTENFNPPAAPFLNPTITLVPPPGVDPYINNVSLLLHMDGENNGTTFVDSSPNALAVVATGDAVVSTGEIKFGSASGYFNGGSNSFLTVPASANFAYGTEDFTIECWINSADLSSWHVIYGQSTPGSNYCVLGAENGLVQFLFNYSNPGAYVYGGSITAGTWHHIAVCRKEGVATVYVDGVGGTPAACTFDFANTTFTPQVGSYGHNTSYNFNGYIDELRVTKGVARYTDNFTPPTAAFPDAAGGGGGGGGGGPITTFIDTSKHNHEVTATGNAYLNLEDIKYGNASGEFAGGHCAIAMSPEFAFDDGDFTVEFWGKLSYAQYSAVFSTATSAQEAGTYLIGFSNDTNMFGFCHDIEAFVFCAANIAEYYNTWTHYAFVRASGVLKMYINGAEVATANASSNLDGGTQTTAVIGRRWTNEDNHYLDGLIDDLRITKGAARYVAEFNPPTKALPDPVIPVVTPPNNGDQYAEYVTLLLHMDGADGSTNFVDNSYLQNMVTAEGSAAISTTQSKFGGASLLFPGNGGNLVVTHSAALDFGTGNFTFEFWYYPISISTGNGRIGGLSCDGGNPWNLYVYSNGNVAWGRNCVGDDLSVPSGLVTGQWQHIAVARDAGVVRIFVDGVLKGSDTLTQAYDNFGGLTIGPPPAEFSNFGDTFNGYIDDLRITKGVARYTENFTPPTVPFPSPFVPGPTADVQPTDVTGCDLWLDSTGDIGEVNGAIVTWADKSGNGRTATPADYAPAPFVAVGEGPKGQDVVRFSGDPNVLDVSYQFNLKNSSGLVLLGQTVPPPDCAESRPERVLSFQPVSGLDWQNNDGMVLHHGQNDGGGGSNSLNLYSAGQQSSASVSCPLEWSLVSYVIDNSGNVRFRLNGVDADSAAFSAIANKAGAELLIGHGGEFFQSTALRGDIAEIALFDHALGEAALIALERGVISRCLPPPAITPSLLLHMDGADGSTTFTDSSLNGLTATAVGAAQISTEQSRFGTGSAAFDGNGSWIEIPSTNAAAFSDGDFTVELWARWNSVPTSSQWSAGQNSLVNVNIFNGFSLFWSAYDHWTSVSRGVLVLSQRLTYIALCEWTPSTGQWYHIAVARESGVTRLFVDGVQVGTDAADSTDYIQAEIQIGGSGDGAQWSLDGYIDELRIVKGTAVYTANFTPPNAPFLPPQPEPPAAVTSLLLHFDTDFTDSSPNSVVLTPFGAAAISTAQSKFGGASLYLDPQGGLVDDGTASVVDFGAGDGTVECWIYILTGVPASNFGGVASSVGSSGTSGLNFGFFSLSRPNASFMTVGVDTGSSDISLNEWHHIAWVVSAGVLSVYVDGLIAGTAALAGTLDVPGVYVGNLLPGVLIGLECYIDELRITKGAAVYTANFTPPTAPFNS